MFIQRIIILTFERFFLFYAKYFSVSFLCLHLWFIHLWFLGKKAMTILDSVLKCRGITLLTKVHIVQVMVFPIVMYRCECWTIKKAECWIVAFKLWCWRKLLRVRSNQVNPTGDQPWILIGRTEAQAEAPTLWPPVEKSWLIGKDPDSGKDWGQAEKWATENEIVG